MMKSLLGKTLTYFLEFAHSISVIDHLISIELCLVMLSSSFWNTEDHSPTWIRYLGSCYVLYGHIMTDVYFIAHL